MDKSLSYLERAMHDRQADLLAEAYRLAAVRAARSGRQLAGGPGRASERAILSAAARPGVTLALQPRAPTELAADCVAKIAAWRRAAAGFGRSLVSVGHWLEHVGRAA